MSIYMLGIDHNQAALDVRAAFSFTKKEMRVALEKIQILDGVSGCVVLSTCNRMEIWVNQDGEMSASLYEILCDIKGVESSRYRGCFRERSEEEAIYHLFHLACGLKSQILGEDQIITQVGDALAFARENGYTDSVLEVLFRRAITAAKKVKTEVVFPRGNISVINKAISVLDEKGITARGKKCMVIGNGEMGKAAARAFVEAGAKVIVTVRQYRHGMVEIPAGCKAVDYMMREEEIQDCDFIVSATTSPHYTLTKSILEKHLHSTKCENGKLILIDLAVPRDIEVLTQTLEQVELYDVDDFKVDGKEERLIRAMEQAEDILQEQIQEFYSWRDGHNMIPRIQFVKDEVVNDLNLRLTKVMHNVTLCEEERTMLSNTIDKAADKVINKLLFGLKDSLEQEVFMACVEGLEHLYDE